jgi:phage-related protein
MDAVAAAVDANDALANACETSVNDAVQAMTTAISNANMGGIGRNMVNGIADGVRASKSSLLTAMVTAVEEAIKAAKDAAEIKSPSRRMRREVGQMLSAGGAQGIRDGTPEMVAAAHDQMGAVLDEYEGAPSPTLMAQFLTEFDDIPVDFFAMGENAGEQFAAGFNLSTLGFMSMLENVLLGTPELAMVSSAQGARQYGDVNINFNQPVDSPDTTARGVRNVFEYGMAGERN